MSSRRPTPPKSSRRARNDAPRERAPRETFIEREARTAARRGRRERRLKGSSAVCVQCGEADLDVLIHNGRTVLQDHHPSGRQHEPQVEVVLCLNCHAKEHERMRAGGVVLQAQPTSLDALVSVHRSRAVTFRALSDAESRWAERLEQARLVLDRLAPDWRDALRKAEGGRRV